MYFSTILCLTCFGNKYFNKDVEKKVVYFIFLILSFTGLYIRMSGKKKLLGGTLGQKLLYKFLEKGGKIILALVANFANPAFVTICYLFGLQW